jgi:hypothetical protein
MKKSATIRIKFTPERIKMRVTLPKGTMSHGKDKHSRREKFKKPLDSQD